MAGSSFVVAEILVARRLLEEDPEAGDDRTGIPEL